MRSELKEKVAKQTRLEELVCKVLQLRSQICELRKAPKIDPTIPTHFDSLMEAIAYKEQFPSAKGSYVLSSETKEDIKALNRELGKLYNDIILLIPYKNVWIKVTLQNDTIGIKDGTELIIQAWDPFMTYEESIEEESC